MSEDELIGAYVKGGVSRRVFIRGLIAAGVTAGAAVAYADALSAQGRRSSANASRIGPDAYDAYGTTTTVTVPDTTSTTAEPTTSTTDEPTTSTTQDGDGGTGSPFGSSSTTSTSGDGGTGSPLGSGSTTSTRVGGGTGAPPRGDDSGARSTSPTKADPRFAG